MSIITEVTMEMKSKLKSNGQSEEGVLVLGIYMWPGEPWP